MNVEIVVRKNGRITIPVGIRKKLKIEQEMRFEVIVTEEGLFLKPKK